MPTDAPPRQPEPGSQAKPAAVVASLDARRRWNNKLVRTATMSQPGSASALLSFGSRHGLRRPRVGSCDRVLSLSEPQRRCMAWSSFSSCKRFLRRPRGRTRTRWASSCSGQERLRWSADFSSLTATPNSFGRKKSTRSSANSARRRGSSSSETRQSHSTRSASISGRSAASEASSGSNVVRRSCQKDDMPFR